MCKQMCVHTHGLHKNNTGAHFERILYKKMIHLHTSPNQTIWSQMLSKYRQKFAKSPNQNICSQTLLNFARFPEAGDKFANMATLA